MVEAMRRRERERVVAEVALQMQGEREALLRAERDRLQKEVEDSLAHREILAENQRKIEVASFA